METRHFRSVRDIIDRFRTLAKNVVGFRVGPDIVDEIRC